jgi:hypothetical protein
MTTLTTSPEEGETWLLEIVTAAHATSGCSLVMGGVYVSPSSAKGQATSYCTPLTKLVTVVSIAKSRATDITFSVYDEIGGSIMEYDAVTTVITWEALVGATPVVTCSTDDYTIIVPPGEEDPTTPIPTFVVHLTKANIETLRTYYPITYKATITIDGVDYETIQGILNVDIIEWGQIARIEATQLAQTCRLDGVYIINKRVEGGALDCQEY